MNLRISSRKLNIETGRLFRDVIEFVLFVASILKMRFTFCLIAQNIHQLETTFLIKYGGTRLIRTLKGLAIVSVLSGCVY